jgi:hypothetical protein
MNAPADDAPAPEKKRGAPTGAPRDTSHNAAPRVSQDAPAAQAADMSVRCVACLTPVEQPADCYCKVCLAWHQAGAVLDDCRHGLGFDRKRWHDVRAILSPRRTPESDAEIIQKLAHRIASLEYALEMR